MTDNGSYVTRAELAAHLGPMREDVQEIRDDVKSLLASQARTDAKAEVSRDSGARRLGWGGLVMGCIGGLWWVQDAIAKLTH